MEQGTIEVARELVRCGHRAIVIAARGRMVSQLEEAGAEHLDWDIGRKSAVSLRHVLPLRRLLRSRQVDILHARSRLPAWIAYAAWRSLRPSSRPRFVTTVHGLYSVNRYSAIMTRGEPIIAISAAVPAGDLGALLEKTVDFVCSPRQVAPSTPFTLRMMLDQTLALYENPAG